MATVNDLFQILSSFWKEHVEGQDQVFIAALWDGFSKSVSDAYLRLYQYDQAKSIGSLKSTLKRTWFNIDLAYTNATVDPFTYEIDQEIISIPLLQEGVSIPGIQIVDSTDYVINTQAHTITFLTPAAKALVTRTISLNDSLGNRTIAGKFVDSSGLTPLTVSVDYDLPDANTLVLYSKAAFDLLAATGDPQSLKALQALVLFAPNLETDEQLAYRNFGFLLGISPADVPLDVDLYTRTVKGLWYIAWNGPTPDNLTNGISVLFGYPVAPFAGKVLRISPSGPNQVVTLVPTALGDTQDVLVPSGFSVTVSVGDSVIENQALSDAVQILDEISSPSWWQDRLSLERYAAPGFSIQGKTSADLNQLRSTLRNAVFGIKLKDFNTFTDMDTRAQILITTASFLNRLKPYYSQFSIIGDVLFSEVGPDTVTPQDVSLVLQANKTMEETIADNPVNQLFDTAHDTSIFADYAAYVADPAPGDADDIAYYLGADQPATSESLLLEVAYPGSGGFVPLTDAGYIAFANSRLADINPPRIYLTPDPGLYYAELSIRIRTHKPSRILYTLDGTTPTFGPPQVGLAAIDRILIQPGDWTIKVVAKDLAGNTSVLVQARYLVIQGLPKTLVTPTDIAPLKDPVAAVLANAETSVDVFYTTDGSAPSDFAFQDIARLGGHRIVWDSPTSIRLEDPNKPIFFSRGTATINIDGPRNYEISPKPNTRYFIYAVRISDNRWRLNISNENIRFEPNTTTKLMLGFVVSGASGEFPETGVINAVDSGDVQVLTKDSGLANTLSLSPVPLNKANPIGLSNDKDVRVLRFFAKTPGGLFDPPQTFTYIFDTIPPTTVLKSSFVNKPFKKTLKIEFETTQGSIVYWSNRTKSPSRVIFGLADRLDNGSQQLRITNPAPNQIAPSLSTFTLTFTRTVATGETITLTATADLRSGAALTIPSDTPLAFYDIAVVPDFDNTNKWRLIVGEANTPIMERSDTYLVARVTTDNAGVLDINAIPDPATIATRSTLVNAVDSGAGLRKTQKYVEPILINVSASSYHVVVSYFAVDVAGNTEEIRSQVFDG